MSDEPSDGKAPISTNQLQKTVLDNRVAPSTNAQPTTNVKPTTNAQPAANVKPAPNAQPAANVKPATNAQPAANVKPTTNAQPAANVKPGTNAQPAANVKPATNAQPAPNSDNAKDAAKDAKDAEQSKGSEDDTEDESDDTAESTDTAEIFYEIRDIYDEKRGMNKETEDLIRSQSCSSVFVYRRKTRDVGSNIIDNWVLSSFEERTYSMEIAPSFIEISPVTVDLDDDITRLLSITDAEHPMLNNTGLELVLSSFTNLIIPESVMTYIKENCYDITTLPVSYLIPETFSSFNYIVLLLTLLGLSIFSFMIYKLVVWLFMLDQNPEHDLSVNTYNNVGSPINMESYNTCLFPPGFDEEKE